MGAVGSVGAVGATVAEAGELWFLGGRAAWQALAWGSVVTQGQGDDGITWAKAALAEAPDRPQPLTAARRAAMELLGVPVGEAKEGRECQLAGSQVSIQGKRRLSGLRQLSDQMSLAGWEGAEAKAVCVLKSVARNTVGY